MLRKVEATFCGRMISQRSNRWIFSHTSNSNTVKCANIPGVVTVTKFCSDQPFNLFLKFSLDRIQKVVGYGLHLILTLLLTCKSR